MARSPLCTRMYVWLYFANLILIRLQHVAVAIVYPVPSKSPKYTRSLYDWRWQNKPFQTRKRAERLTSVTPHPFNTQDLAPMPSPRN